MRLLDYLIGGLALLTLPFLLWWGIYQSPQSAVNLQARLEANARAALAEGGVDWASVRMEGQRAVLTGAAPSSDAVTEAARTVRRSSGPGGVVFGGVTQVESRADAAPPISPYVWRAQKTAEGQIVLSGHVPTKAIQASLVEDARLVGRAAVDDQMKAAAGAPAGNFQGVARFALTQLSRLDEGEVTITDYRVVLRGEVADDEARRQVMAAMGGLAAPFRGEPLLGGKARWQATLADGTLTLSGTVYAEAERRELLAAAAGFAGQVVDGMTLSEVPADSWIAGARAALPHFAAFREGEMAFDAEANVFRFEGAASASTLYFLKEDMARAGGSWRAVYGTELTGFDPDLTGIVTPVAAGEPQAPCAAGLEVAVASGEIAFAGNGTIARESGPVLDRIAAAASACDSATRIEIRAETQVQASEVADFLVLAGMPRARLAAISYGSVPGEPDTQLPTTGPGTSRPVTIRIAERSGE